MMGELLKRGELLAHERQRRILESVASRLRGMFGDRAVESEDGQVSVGERGFARRRLLDPGLRFVLRGHK